MALRVGPTATKSRPVTKTITFKKGPVAKPSQSIKITPAPTSNVTQVALIARNPGLKPIAKPSTTLTIPGATISFQSKQPIIKANPVISAAVAASNARTTITPKINLNPIIPSGNVSVFRVAQAAAAAQHGPNYSQQQYFNTLQKIKTQSDTIPLKSAVKIMDNAISTKKSLDNLSATMKPQTGKPFSKPAPMPTKTITFKPLTGAAAIKAKVVDQKATAPILKPQTNKYQASPAVKAAVAAQITQKAASTPKFTITPVKIEPTLKSVIAVQKTKEQKTQFVANPLKLNTYTAKPEPKLKIMAVKPENLATYDGTKYPNKWIFPVTDFSLTKQISSIRPGKGPEELLAWSKTSRNPVVKQDYIDGKVQCLQLSTRFVDAARRDGFDAYLITLEDLDAWEGHAMIGLRIGSYIYTYDPYTNLNMSLASSWNLIKPGLSVYTSLVRDPYQMSPTMIDTIKNTPSFLAANQTINKKILAGETFPIEKTVPMFSFFEPKFKDKGVIIGMKDLDNYESSDGNDWFFGSDYDLVRATTDTRIASLEQPVSKTSSIAWVSDDIVKAGGLHKTGPTP